MDSTEKKMRKGTRKEMAVLSWDDNREDTVWPGRCRNPLEVSYSECLEPPGTRDVIDG
jgi:hypothetical protein